MRRYIVTIRRVVYTEVSVKARNTHEARERIVVYGADFAAVDFPRKDELVGPASVVRVRVDPSPDRDPVDN